MTLKVLVELFWKCVPFITVCINHRAENCVKQRDSAPLHLFSHWLKHINNSCTTADSSTRTLNSHTHTHAHTQNWLTFCCRHGCVVPTHIQLQHTCHNRAQLSRASPFTLFITPVHTQTHPHTHSSTSTAHTCGSTQADCVLTPELTLSCTTGFNISVDGQRKNQTVFFLYAFTFLCCCCCYSDNLELDCVTTCSGIYKETTDCGSDFFY